MKKAMLSQPMAGKTDEEIISTRDRAIKVLEENGYTIVNTLFTDEWYNEELFRFRFATLQRALKVCHFVIQHISAKAGRTQEAARLNMKRLKLMDSKLFMNKEELKHV